MAIEFVFRFTAEPGTDLRDFGNRTSQAQPLALDECYFAVRLPRKYVDVTEFRRGAELGHLNFVSRCPPTSCKLLADGLGESVASLIVYRSHVAAHVG